MKLNKKVIESMVVLCSLCVMTTITAVTNDGAMGAQFQASGDTEGGNTGLEANGNAGVAAVFTDYELALAEELENMVWVEQTRVDVVTASVDEAEAEPVEAEQTEAVLSEEEQQWQSYLMANVEQSLNVRAAADENADVVGKLYKGDLAVVVERGEQWTQITSGNVVGYVSNAYCVFGTDALNYAKANCETVATSTTSGLRVRKEQSTEAEIVTTIGEGESITVNTSAEVQAGWVAVTYKSNTCYVSADYVVVAIQTGTGVTLEEEAAIKAAEEAAAKKAAEEAEAKKNKAAQKTSSGTTTGSSLASTVDEVTLLAALIQCEAGGQSYECQLAVGAVVVNRVKSSYYASSIYSVIHQKGQFGPVTNGSLSARLSKGPSSTAIQAATEALAGADNTGGATCFKLASSGHAGVVVGALVFY